MTPALPDRRISFAATTTSVVLAAAFVATMTTVFWPRVAHAIGVRPEVASAPPAYRAGDVVDVPAAWYRSAGAAKTLVIFGRAACGACEQAQAFLKTLTATAASHGVHVVFAGGADTHEEDASFARALGVEAGSIVSAPAGLRVHLTPTLVLVSAGGRVIDAWEGVGDPPRRAAIAREIGR